MTEPTKEQIEKWTIEAEKHFPRPFWGGRDGDMDEWHGKIEGYIAAKKSDFEEIQTLNLRITNQAINRINAHTKIVDNYELLLSKKDQEIKTLKEQLVKAEKVIKISQHIFDEDEADIAMDYANKYFQDKDKQGEQKRYEKQ